MSLTVKMHTTDDDFAKTKEYLEILLAHGTWKVPNLKSTLSRGLGANQPTKRFIPMQLHIDNNREPPVVGQNGRIKVEPGDIFTLPQNCLQLAKASEFLYHDVLEGQVAQCVPKDTKKYEGRSYDKIYYEAGIENHIRKMSENSLRKGLSITKMLVLNNITTPEFAKAMRGDFKAAIRYFKTLVTNDISYHVFSDQWKAVSFDFIHHEGIRADGLEENIRQDMRKIVFYCLAIMFYGFYRHCIQLEAGYGKPNYPNEHGGFESVKVNYRCYTSWGRTKTITRSRFSLPAAPNFTKRKQVRQAKAANTRPGENVVIEGAGWVMAGAGLVQKDVSIFFTIESSYSLHCYQ